MDKPAGTVTFSKAELAAMDGSSGIDMERKESYLSAGEFVEVFGMERWCSTRCRCGRGRLRRRKRGCSDDWRASHDWRSRQTRHVLNSHILIKFKNPLSQKVDILNARDPSPHRPTRVSPATPASLE